MKRKILYAVLFVFCTWLALATRSHKDWFPHLVLVYGGDIIWAGMFVFLLRIFFTKPVLWKLALINYGLGVLDEFSQLNQSPFMLYLRSFTLGRLMLGVGFLWSDIVCYATGTFIGWVIALVIEKYLIVI
jgi:hypothetical protein